MKTMNRIHRTEETAELIASLKSMIAEHGYDATLAAIEDGWENHRFTWPAYLATQIKR